MMPGHQFADVAEQRAVLAGVTKREHFGKQFLLKRGRNRRMLEQSFDFRSKGEQTAVPIIVERLDAKSVAGAKQPLPLAIPDSVSEHAAKKLDAVRAVL